MHLGVFGATGTIGRRVVQEAVARRHRVSAFARDASRFPEAPEAVSWSVADVTEVDSVAANIDGLDVIVNAIGPGRDVSDAMANSHVLPAAARALLSAMERHPSVRLIVVGGAGSLEVHPGLQVADVPGFADSLPATLGVPVDYEKVVLAHREALTLYRVSNRKWTYVSPSAGLVTPGERTARFRIGGDRLLVAADGTSDISAEDLAVAIIDEAEIPQHVQRRFTVGY